MREDIEKEILEALEELKGKVSYDCEQHKIEHEFLKKMMVEYDERLKLLSDIKSKLVVGSIWSVIVAIVTMLGYSIKTWLSQLN